MGYQRDQTLPGEAVHRPDVSQDEPPPVYRPTSSPRNTNKPPLPPRDTGHISMLENDDGGGRYYSQPTTFSWADQDPRNASTESLSPQNPAAHRRDLYLIYIHGFMGDEQSFRSFPAHVHNVVTQLLAKTHDVHTKIYPRYKSRKTIEFARDSFSKWLEPHESPATDVILLGHSMGGLLSAEVALLAPPDPSNPEPFSHRILGTVNFDTPFMGMHPGVVIAGLGSIFRPKPDSPSLKATQTNDAGGALSPVPNSPGASLSASEYFPSGAASSSGLSLEPSVSRLSSLPSPAINDPNYNPPFANDINLPVRKGWNSALHFVMKHSDGLTKATKSFVQSHIEFGSAMADYKALNARYKKLRVLEDVDDTKPRRQDTFRSPRRVRFVNFYTASTGVVRPTISSKRSPQVVPADSSLSEDIQDLSLSERPTSTLSGTKGSLLAAQHTGSNLDSLDGNLSLMSSRYTRKDECNVDEDVDHLSEMEHLDPQPFEDEDETINNVDASRCSIESITKPDTEKMTESGETIIAFVANPTIAGISENTIISSPVITLPPLPDEPMKPVGFDSEAYTDKDSRKLAEKEHDRLMKGYIRAIKDREEAIKARRKLVEKKEKEWRKGQEKALKDEKRALEKQEKERLREEKEKAKTQKPQSSDASIENTDKSAGNHMPLASEDRIADTASTFDGAQDSDKQKKQRDKKFCMLPPKGANGQRDPTWVRVFMEGVDEVGAHISLFFPEKAHYEQLVKDISFKMQEWTEHAEEARQRESGD